MYRLLASASKTVALVKVKIEKIREATKAD
jgi:hypothetical protein